MNGSLVIQNEPDLQAPYLLVGLRGWLNAGEVSTGSIDYLRRNLGARKFAHIESRGFYVYQVPSSSPELSLRPRAKIEEGLVTKVELPQNEFHFWKSGTPHDLILFSGVEPNLEWPAYAQAVLDIARRFQVTRTYILGGVYDQVPHTRRTTFYSVMSHARLRDEIGTIAPSLYYEGPCSFTTMLLHLAAEQGIEAAGITARMPLYIQDYNAKACYDLLRNMLALTRFDIDLGDLRQARDGLVEMMDRTFSQNQKAMEQLKKLEEMFDAAYQEQPHHDPVGDYDKLIEEMRRMKTEGRKPH